MYAHTCAHLLINPCALPSTATLRKGTTAKAGIGIHATQQEQEIARHKHFQATPVLLPITPTTLALPGTTARAGVGIHRQSRRSNCRKLLATLHAHMLSPPIPTGCSASRGEIITTQQADHHIQSWHQFPKTMQAQHRQSTLPGMLCPHVYTPITHHPCPRPTQHHMQSPTSKVGMLFQRLRIDSTLLGTSSPCAHARTHPSHHRLRKRSADAALSQACYSHMCTHPSHTSYTPDPHHTTNRAPQPIGISTHG